MKSILQRYIRSIPTWPLGLGALILVTAISTRLNNDHSNRSDRNNSAQYAWPVQCTTKIYKIVDGAEVPTSPAVTYYINGFDLCLEVLPKPGDLCRVISNHEQTRSWLIYVDRREYKEITRSASEKEQLPLGSQGLDSFARSELRALGMDRIDGEQCEKFEFEGENQEEGAVIWVNRTLGNIVKLQHIINGVTVGFKVVSVGAPDASLFQIPSGFRQVYY
jgi:hypothetical protein